MPSTAVVASSFILVLASALAGYIYVFGIPPEIKKKLERSALKTLGENKASYMMKSSIAKVPESDQKEFNETKEKLGNLAGGTMQNPLGEFAGESADSVTAPFTGR